MLGPSKALAHVHSFNDESREGGCVGGRVHPSKVVTVTFSNNAPLVCMLLRAISSTLTCPGGLHSVILLLIFIFTPTLHPP